MTIDEEILKLDLIASDAFEGGDANEFRQLAEWLRELKERREIQDILLQFILDEEYDICCDELAEDEKEWEICEKNCNNHTKECWLRWAKMKAREVNANDA